MACIGMKECICANSKCLWVGKEWSVWSVCGVLYAYSQIQIQVHIHQYQNDRQWVGRVYLLGGWVDIWLVYMWDMTQSTKQEVCVYTPGQPASAHLNMVSIISYFLFVFSCICIFFILFVFNFQNVCHSANINRLQPQ